MKKALLGLVLSLGLLFVPVLPAATSPLASVARIQFDGGSCSTFSIDEQFCYYVTTAHCAPAELDQVILSDPETDIAVLKLPECAPRLRLAGSEPALGDAVKILGYPGKQNWPLALTGAVAAVESGYREGKVRNIFHEGAGPGMSGGPVLNSKGEVVGIVSEVKQIPSIIMASPTVRMLKKVAGQYWQK